MSKNSKTVFDKMTEALNNALTEIDTTNSYLYGIGVELADINTNLKALIDTIASLHDSPFMVIVDTASLLQSLSKTAESLKPASAETPTGLFTIKKAGTE